MYGISSNYYIEIKKLKSLPMEDKKILSYACVSYSHSSLVEERRRHIGMKKMSYKEQEIKFNVVHSMCKYDEGS